MRRLFEHLSRSGNYGYFWRLPSRESEWFSTLHRPAIPTGSDVYWGVHPTVTIPRTNAAGACVDCAKVRAQIPYIISCNCLFAEFDAKDFAGSKDLTLAYIRNKLFVYPSVIIDSGGGYHCYFCFADPFVLDTDADRKRMDALQKAFVKAVGSDQGAKDLARVLRVPGTLNTKYTPARPVHIVEAEWSEWAFDDLEALVYANVPAENAASEVILPKFTPASGAKQLAGWLYQRQEGERNNSLLWAACRAFDKGMSLPDVEALLCPVAEAIGLSSSEIAATIRSASHQERRAL